MPKFQTEVRLSREMSLLDATLIGVGAMIGAGIFVLTGIAAGVAGPALILVFGLNGVITLFTAISYAELGSCYNDAGGGYLWVKEALPHWNGFLSGWMSWFAHAVACSVYALGFGAYFGYLLAGLGFQVPQWSFLGPQKLLAIFAAIVFAYVNFRGASETGKVGNVVTGTKVVILLIFIAFGLALLAHAGAWRPHFTPFMPHGWSGIFKAMGLTFIAFEGYEIIAQSSEEIRNPRRNIPRAVFLSLAIVIPIYLLVAFVALGTVHTPAHVTPWDYLAAQKEIALVDVAQRFFSGGGLMVLAAGLISTMSALNATVFSSSRVAFAMGRDRNFPGFFSRVHSKNYTPHWAILLSTFIIIFMALALPIEDVATASDVMFLLIFLQVNLALITLRKKRPDLDRGFVAPLFPWLAIIGVIVNLGLALYMFTYSLKAWMVTAGWIGAGLLIYKFYAASREVEYARTVKVLEQLEKKEYKILVCVSRRGLMPGLGPMAWAMARKHRAEVLFLSVVEVEENQPLRSGLEETMEARRLVEEASEASLAQGIRARPIVRVAHRISEGIVETAREESCNFIIIGRQKQPRFFERFFSSLIDTVIQESPTEVAVLHGPLRAERVESILIPFGQDVHTRLAVETALAFQDFYHCAIRIAVVFEPETPYSERGKKAERIRKLIEENALRAEVVPLHDADILRAIVREARNADLLLMGARTGDFLQLMFGRSLTREITEAAACPVLWIKEFEERPSFWSLLIQPAQQEARP